MRRNSMDEVHSDLGEKNNSQRELGEIFIQDAHQANMDNLRKEMKKFDYKIEKEDQNLLEIIESYTWGMKIEEKV